MYINVINQICQNQLISKPRWRSCHYSILYIHSLWGYGHNITIILSIYQSALHCSKVYVKRTLHALLIKVVFWPFVIQPNFYLSDWACGLWQFSTHFPPIFYSSFLIGVVYHAFITLFLDYSGGYEERAKRLYPLILLVITTICTIIAAPSGYFGVAKSHFNEHEMSHFRQHCNLQVPSLMISDDKMTPDMYSESQASYRFVYELVLPYLLPIFILGK